MKEFIFLFRGGKTSTATDAQLDAHEEAWDEWMDGLEQSGVLIDGMPMRETALIVTGEGIMHQELGNDMDVSGYLILETEDLDTAAALAAECPIFQFGGTVEVRELFSESEED